MEKPKGVRSQGRKVARSPGYFSGDLVTGDLVTTRNQSVCGVMAGLRLFFIMGLLMPLTVVAQPLQSQPSWPAARQAPSDAKTVGSVSGQPVQGEESEPIEEEVPYSRDPFGTWIPSKVPLAAQGTQGVSALAGAGEPAFDSSAYQVTGTVWGVEKARAIINGKVVGVGDQVDDAEILRIDRQGILLRFEKKVYLLSRENLEAKGPGEVAQ